MTYSFDPILVIFSIIVSVVGAYTCFDLVIKIRTGDQTVNRKLLVGASFAIGGSIWSMHFVAMLALNLPIVIQYDVLLTLISGLVSVLMTAVALLIVSSAAYDLRRTLIAGAIMGLGISSMHYIGMSAIRGNCDLTYSTLWVFTSIAIGMGASTASLWSATQLRGVWRRIVAALVMGVSISGVHYTGMAGTSFLPLDKALEYSQPIFSPFSLGLTTAVATFIILGWTLLTLMPEPQAVSHGSASSAPDKAALESTTETESADKQADFHIDKLPVQKNQRTYFVYFADIVSVTSDGHYTTVHTKDGESHFCNHSLSQVEEELNSPDFLRVHRRHIINLHHVESFERQHDKGLVFSHGGEQPIPVSRTNISKLQEALGI
ncbi:MAG: LytTR family transcriptional regulator DNA-binding domain-containing protein [Gammaproteobacteria bacterium]|nr:LytTR family transcriptional regulator DNA-binding domain-containing protein [Gammaproteobacteria bacterium]